MQIALYKTDVQTPTVRKKAVGAYWVVTLCLFGLELVMCSAPVANDVHQVLTGQSVLR